MEASGVDYAYEVDKLPYTLYYNYNPDWTLNTLNGKMFIEAKGYFRGTHKAKMAAVKKQHPELDIRFVFYTRNPNKLSKTELSNGKWAMKYGFKFAYDSIPEDWLAGV